MTYRRLTDNDLRIGHFIVLGRSELSYRPIGFHIDSGDGEHPGCSLNFQAFGYWLQVAIPSVIKPWRKWVDLTKYDWAHSKGYWDVHARKYGFSLSEGFLQVFLGAQTHDSSTYKTWCKHLPWTQWRFMRKSYYGKDGEHLRTFIEGKARGDNFKRYEETRAFEETVPTVRFSFADYDGERIEAATHIQECEWHAGTGWFKWVSLFRRPKIRRYLDIAFSKEVGPRKGSWKGGTLGHSINMLPGELHEGAFARYCAEQQLIDPRILEV